MLRRAYRFFPGSGLGALGGRGGGCAAGRVGGGFSRGGGGGFGSGRAPCRWAPAVGGGSAARRGGGGGGCGCTGTGGGLGFEGISQSASSGSTLIGASPARTNS